MCWFERLFILLKVFYKQNEGQQTKKFNILNVKFFNLENEFYDINVNTSAFKTFKRVLQFRKDIHCSQFW